MEWNWTYLEKERCYALLGIPYCGKPSAPELQKLNFYVPEGFLQADGSLQTTKMVQTRSGAEWTAATVPVVLYNDIGGYSECRPAELTRRNRRFLEDGYVLVSVGARGRQTAGEDGRFLGKAPGGLVDLKAAVRWLRSHRQTLPGNFDRIVSVGTSAGGATSALLGITGNCPDYLPYLEDIGAEMEQRDDVFAAQCYCPIADLSHADMAYEWMFRSKKINTFGMGQSPHCMTAGEQRLSETLAQAYPAYLNGLGLERTLGEDGRSGSFYQGILDQIGASLTRFLVKNGETEADRISLVEELNAGTNLFAWKDGRAEVRDLDQYVRVHIGRMKGCPAFDGSNSYENELFGSESEPYRHFSAATAAAMAACGDPRAEEYARDTAQPSLQQAVGLMDQIGYLRDPRGSAVAPHFRIRVGARDADTSFAISYSLYLALQAAGVQADYGLVWGLGHCDADEPGAFSAWVDELAGPSC